MDGGGDGGPSLHGHKGDRKVMDGQFEIVPLSWRRVAWPTVVILGRRSSESGPTLHRVMNLLAWAITL
jgi:hypothetical protein